MSTPAATREIPRLSQVYFYLTEGCNLACRHCWLSPHFERGAPSKATLPVGQFLSILDQALPLGLDTVKLTGGEPFYHPSIDALLEHVRERGLRLTIETNGTLCTPSRARAVAHCRDPFVSVSIDGADAATHDRTRGVAGSFTKACDAVKMLGDAGVTTQVIMVLSRSNVGALDDVWRLAHSLGATSLKINVLQPTGRGAAVQESGDALGIGELVSLGMRCETDPLFDRGPSVYFDHPPAFRPLSKLARPDGCGACGITGIIGVLATGEYGLCGIGQLIKELSFGTVQSNRLADIWRDHPMLNEIRDGLPGRLHGVCADCIMKERCLGSCVAQNYVMHKNFWAPFWYCDLAADAGLFPNSRLHGRVPIETGVVVADSAPEAKSETNR